MRPLACFFKPKHKETLFVASIKRKSAAVSTTPDDKKFHSTKTKKKSLSSNVSRSLPKTEPVSDIRSNTDYKHKLGAEDQSHSSKSEISKFPKCKVEKGTRKNEFNIQMLSENLYHQIFGKYDKPNPPDPDLIEEAQKRLKEHGLWKEDIQFLKNVSLKLPPLQGKNIQEHFWNIGKKQSEPYQILISSFLKSGIPNPPEKWVCKKGWTKYEAGKEPVSVTFPEEDILVFDVEVCMKLGGAPTLATAVSGKAWYGWVCFDLAEGLDPVPKSFYTPDMLIPLEGKNISSNKPRVIVGYNVSYDRARVKEQYNIKSSALRFLDTLSIHNCIGGLTTRQKAMLRKTENAETESESWHAFACLSSLKEAYSLYCNKEIAKDTRNLFVEKNLSDIRKNFQNAMAYCSQDVLATFEVLQVIFPVFLERFPHPVTLAGMLEMGSAFLPVNNNWKKFIADVDQTYEDLKNEVTTVLSRQSDNACRLLHNNDYMKNLWMWDEDWSIKNLKLTKRKLKPSNETQTENSNKENENEDVKEKELERKFQYLFDLGHILPKKKPFLPGYPMWYRKLCQKADSQEGMPLPQLSTSLQVTPKLLQLSWENYPLYHTTEFGWGILVADISKEKPETNVPFESLKELTLKNCNINMDEVQNFRKMKVRSGAPLPYYKGNAVWCNHIVDDCCYFFKLPHKNGSSFNVGNPLSKDFVQVFSKNLCSSLDSAAERVIDIWNKISYWRNNRERILNQMVVWLNGSEFCSSNELNEVPPVGVIIPKVLVCGTLTRRAMEATWLTASKVCQNRIGSELRSMIQAPPGYHFVGADVDSQELWISSLIGDSNVTKIHGSTPFGWMTLYGTKSSETDLHSMTAKAIGISREHAKILNYARIYGAGVKFAGKLLRQFNPSMSSQEAHQKAVKMYSLTKGEKVFKVKNSSLRDFQRLFKSTEKYCNSEKAIKMIKMLNKKASDVFEKPCWMGGTESDMFNHLEEIANSWEPKTPFLQSRLSRALEPKFQGEKGHLTTRVNWVVQSGAVDFLHLMLVCMKWLTNGRARYCFSFHDEVRFLVPTEERYNAALAMHITNLLVRSFCSHCLGMYDLPQSVAFFSSVEVDKTLRKESYDDCITPSNPHGIEKDYGVPPGESLDVYQAINKSGGSFSLFDDEQIQAPCQKQQKENMYKEKCSTTM